MTRNYWMQEMLNGRRETCAHLPSPVQHLSNLLTLALCLLAPLSLADAPAGEIRLTDDTGHTLVLDKPASRIVSLAPNITETLFAVGAGSQIIATVDHSDYPQAALDIPRIGTYTKINRESLVALEPDLVIAWETGNGPDVVAHLRRLGLPVFAIEPRTLTDIATSLRQFGTLSGRDAEGEAAALAFLERHEALRRRYQNAAPVTVFYQVWNQPLLTLNDDHLIAQVIHLCGGANVFGDAGPMVPVINTETVLRADPQVIIASGMGEERPDWVDQWRRWSTLTAVRNGHLFFIPPSLVQRQTVRILEGAEMMCDFLQHARDDPHSDAQEVQP